MRRRILVSSLVVVAALLAAVSLRGGSADDRPPFAAEDQWIRLSDDAGLYVTHAPDPRKAVIWIDGRASDEVRTQLWVRVHKMWVPAHLEQAGGRIVPAL
jgi:hypothetical protein